MIDPVLEIFREEARDHLSALERGFLDLEASAIDVRRSLVDNLFRHAHSLKGDARAVAIPVLQRASQVLEDILDGLRVAPESIDREAIDRGLGQLDLVREAFEWWQRDSRPNDELVDVQAAEKAIATQVDEPDASQATELISPAVENHSEPNDLASLGATPPAREHTGAVPATREEAFTVRVPSERLDRMLNLAGETRVSQRVSASIAERLAVMHAHLKRLPTEGRRRSTCSDEASGSDLVAFANWRSQMSEYLRRIESELHKKASREELLVEALEAEVRQARLLPLTMLTDSLRRSIRDLAQSLDKSVRYEVDVGKILLDKVVIESLRETLLHIIRNAIDHGLETPAERLAVGKPAEGCLRIQATQRGESVVMKVSDDGRGIDYAKIRERIRRSGELDEAKLSHLTKRELTDYLFRPGFSTAEAGDVSGRGVGLDVVMTGIHRLHGSLDVATGAVSRRRASATGRRDEEEAESGTTFILQVPVTISTLRILTVLSAGQYYGIPTSMVVRTGSVSERSLRNLQGSPVLVVEGQPVRWVSLSELLNTTASRPIDRDAPQPYFLVGTEGRLTAVAVDDLEDESEVLLKPLGFPLNGIGGVIGGAVRSDGTVQVVLDLIAIAAGKVDRPTPRLEKQVRRLGRIMVVDDSPTTRSILRNVFTAAGYTVRTACDGVDALEHLRTQCVDLVVSDVEMPRMNGLDLTRQIKAKLRLPVVLVTGKEKEEHRREGLEAGADAYVVKSSFEGAGLLEVVNQFF